MRNRVRDFRDSVLDPRVPACAAFLVPRQGGHGVPALPAELQVRDCRRTLRLVAPLSFWGGFDAESGLVIEHGHPDYGSSLRGRLLLMECAKGSSSSSSVLAEALRHGTGPCAMVMLEADLIVALGAIVARELYGVVMPIVVVDAAVWQRLRDIEGPLTVTALDDGNAWLSLP